jgi:hypothetical protein
MIHKQNSKVRYQRIRSTRPSLLEGVGRLFDFGGFLDDRTRTISGFQADRIALDSDKRALYRDFRRALRRSVLQNDLSPRITDQKYDRNGK